MIQIRIGRNINLKMSVGFLLDLFCIILVSLPLKSVNMFVLIVIRQNTLNTLIHIYTFCFLNSCTELSISQSQH